MEKEIIYFRESYLQSVMADITTFGLLTLMMAFNYFYLANNSLTAFTFFIVFLLYAFGKGQASSSVFYSKESLIKHLQEEDTAK